MPRIVDFDLRDFGTDPYGQGERFVERRFDELLELGECQVVLHDDKDSESRENGNLFPVFRGESYLLQR